MPVRNKHSWTKNNKTVWKLFVCIQTMPRNIILPAQGSTEIRNESLWMDPQLWKHNFTNQITNATWTLQQQKTTLDSSQQTTNWCILLTLYGATFCFVALHDTIITYFNITSLLTVQVYIAINALLYRIFGRQKHILVS